MGLVGGPGFLLFSLPMRIIAGEKKRMRLEAPPGIETRPTLDRVRESLFMQLHDLLPGSRVLDLFAGAGTLGLEALSRGAREAVFVESHPPALRSLERNIAHLKLADRTKMIRSEVLAWLGRANNSPAPFDFVFADPPYASGLAEQTLRSLGDSLTTPGTTFVAQIGRRDPMPDALGTWRRISSKTYGETRIDIYRREEQPRESPENVGP